MTERPRSREVTDGPQRAGARAMLRAVGFGDADYKSHFGDASWLEEDVAVFDGRPKPVAVNLALSGVRGTARTAQALARRTGRLPAMRRRWRARLGERAASGVGL